MPFNLKILSRKNREHNTKDLSHHAEVSRQYGRLGQEKVRERWPLSYTQSNEEE